MTEGHYKRLVAWLMDTIETQAQEIDRLRAAATEGEPDGSNHDQHS